MNTWLALGIAIVVEVVGTLALKASNSFTKWMPSLIVVASYGTAFFMLAYTLRSISVGVAYAIWSGLGTVLIALASWFLFGQRLDGWGILGMTLIVAGVLVINLLSQTEAH